MSDPSSTPATSPATTPSLNPAAPAAPAASTAERQMPTSQPVLKRALRWGLIAGAVLFVIFAVVGWFVDGQRGMVGGMLGTAMGIIFLGLTALSVIVANRFHKSDLFVVIYFSVVMGTWVLKFILFIVAAVLLRDQPWLNPTILFLGVISAVLVSLAIDMFVMLKSRVPYVADNILPNS